MTRFRFCLMGATQHPVIEVPVHDITELHEMMSRTRFVEGRMVEVNGEGVSSPVLIAVCRIQMVFADEYAS